MVALLLTFTSDWSPFVFLNHISISILWEAEIQTEFKISGMCQALCLVFYTHYLVYYPETLSSVQSLSRVQLFATPWIAARQASLSITNSRRSFRLTSIESVMPSSHLILCCPLLLLPQSLLASESFPMSQPFVWDGQSIGVSALASFLPKNTQDWSPLGWTGWTSLQSKGLSRVFSSSKASILRCSAFFTVELSHPYMTTGKTLTSHSLG